MTFSELKQRILTSLSIRPKTPKCFSDGNFLYCFCGKCEAESYPLPTDFQNLVIKKAIENYNKK